MKLRPYQQEIITEVRKVIRNGCSSPLIVSPTGSGKTVMFCRIAQGAGAKNKRVWILVHRAELVDQTSRTMTSLGISHGIIAAGWPINPLPHAQIVSVQTVVNRLDRLIPPDVIIVDECHHAAAGTWAKILVAFPKAIRLGFTATPERLDGKGLGDVFQTIIKGPEVSWLIANGFLSPPKYYAPPNQLNLDGLTVRCGDFAKNEVADMMDKPTITGDAIAHYRRFCDGAPGVAFCSSVAHAEHVAEAFRRAGYRAAAIDGTLDRQERRARVIGLSDGSLQIITSCEIISEGFDIPTIVAAILLRPTKSLSLHLQQIGRALRVSPGKTNAIILDHVGNCLRPGLGLAEEEREWSLEGRKKKKRGNEEAPPVRQCPKCYACHEPAPECPECGHVYEIKKREVEQVEGELVELNAELMKKQKRQEQGQAGSLQELIEIGRAREYKNAAFWAKKIWGARMRACE